MSARAHQGAPASPARGAAPLSGSALDVSDVTIQLSDTAHPQVSGVSLHVAPGEVLLVAGPSGAGKSTLVLSVNGTIPQTIPARVRGSITVAGREVARESIGSLSEQVAIVFQDPDSMILTDRVYDEVAFGPENLCLSLDEVDARVHAALTRVGLWEQRDANPALLSGGQKQRLAIASALAMHAPVIVLDEPTANLDPEAATEVYRVVGDLARSGQVAIVLVEHNLDEALEVVDRVVVLDGSGQVVASGTRDDIFRAQADVLAELGVWLPSAVRAAAVLRGCGVPVGHPVTLAELRAHVGTLVGGTGDVAESGEQVVGGEPEVVGGASGLIETVPRPAGPDSREHVRPRIPGGGDTPAVCVRELTVRRSGRVVLDGVTASIPAGSFTAIMGRNGAGKTTLVEAIAGVIRPSAGGVQVAGREAWRLRRAHRCRGDVGYVFQNPEHQFVAQTVAAEVACGVPEQQRSRIPELLARLRLEEKADVNPFTLSGGQKRRLSVAAALATGARVLVLDEPTFGQDQACATELLAILEEQRRMGTTIIVVSHDMELVAEHATDVLVLDQGRVAAAGDARSILTDVPRLASAGLAAPALARAFQGMTEEPVVRFADLSRVRFVSSAGADEAVRA